MTQYDWNDLESLTKCKDDMEEWFKEIEGKPVFDMNERMIYGKVKSRIAELKGEERNIVKCYICGADIDLDNDFDCWKHDEGYACIGCGINKAMGMNIYK